MEERLAEFYRPVCPTLAQVRAMARLAAPGFADFLTVGAFTGLRLEVELAKVHVDHFDPDTDMLWVPKGKLARPRIVPVVADGREALRRAILRSEGGLVFRSPTGAAWTRSSVSRAYIPVRDTVGAPGSFHSLRHFYATFLLNRGAPDLDVAVALGHFDKVGRPNADLVHSTYGHPSHVDALERLSKVAGGPVDEPETEVHRGGDKGRAGTA